MKQLEKIFRIFFLCLLLLFSHSGQQASAQQLDIDSVEIGLITCSPHEEVYSLYGHSAIRFHDLRSKKDIAFNWGVFNFMAPYFELRFVFGMTDYELGLVPFDVFCQYYKHWGSEVTEQVLNLTADEKRKMIDALSENLMPENKVYRYNFFYDNCSTRPRNIIERCINGKIVYQEHPGYRPSYRQMIHGMNAHHPWAAWGNDILLGLTADRETTPRQQEFLPYNLKLNFEGAQIQEANGQVRPLVKEQRIILKQGPQTVEEDNIPTPTQCALAIAVIFALVLAWEVKHSRCLVWFDALWMVMLGLAGCVVLATFFSQHPTTSTNLQILIFNPVHLFFIRSVLKRSPRALYWTILISTTCAMLILSMFQDYADGVEILALSLLSRCWSHRKFKQ